MSQSPIDPTPAPLASAAGGTCTDKVLLIVTGGMLLLIIVLLGVLWLTARARGNQAQLDLQRVQHQTDGRIMLDQLLKDRPIRLQVDRTGLTSRPATLDGRSATVLHLPAGIAREFGFRAGDVIVVDQPASAPAGGAAEP